MNISQILRREDVLLNVESNCIKRVFCDLSEYLASQHDVPQRELYDALNQRERLGSTSVGEGVLIPHTRLDASEKLIGVFARLATPIDVDALDEKKADLVVMLVAPASQQTNHMKVLSRLTRVMRDEQSRAIIRQTDSREDIYKILTSCDL